MSSAVEQEPGAPKPDNKPKDEAPQKLDTESLPELSTKIRQDELDPMELLAQRAIALHLKSLGIDFTKSALDDLFDIVSQYIDGLLHGLQKITQTQRRFKASPKDIRLLLRDYNISTGELEEELIRSKKSDLKVVEKRKELEDLAKRARPEFEETVEDVDIQDPSFVFFAVDQDLTRLIPAQHKRNKIIPSWLPEFPPDHTYRKSPKYLDRITDQKLVRQKLVEESKFGERALENLINYGQKEQIIDDIDMDEPEEEIKEKTNVNDVKPVEENGKTKVDIWDANEKKFDIIAYASARMKFYEKKEEAKKKRREKVDHEYVEIVDKLSAYGPDEQNDNVSPELYLEKQFKSTLQSLQRLKKKKAKRQIERQQLQEEEDRKRDELKAQKAADVNDFDNFDNFENFDNFDNFGDDNNDGGAGIVFEGIDEENKSEQKQDEQDTEQTNEDTNVQEAHGTERSQPTTSQILNSTLETSDVTIESETQNGAPTSELNGQSIDASSEQPNGEGTSLTESSQMERTDTSEQQLPSTAPVPEDDDDEDEDEDMFDDVPIE